MIVGAVSALLMMLLGVLVNAGSVPGDAGLVDAFHRHATSSANHIALALSASGRSRSLIPLACIGAGVLVAMRAWRMAAFGVLSASITPIVSLQLKLLFARDRPDIASIAPEPTFAYPSGHAAASAVFAIIVGVVVWRTPWRWRIVPLVAAWALGVAWSRVYLGVHYPTDVVGGWLLACAVTSSAYGLLDPHRRQSSSGLGESS